jgi:hypothetical protein
VVITLAVVVAQNTLLAHQAVQVEQVAVALVRQMFHQMVTLAL